MIQVNNITKSESKLVSVKKEYQVFTCSDGTEFSTEDEHPWTLTAKERANQHENMWIRINKAKEELKFHSIDADKIYNNGYEREFCFYYHEDLSPETLDILCTMIFDMKRGSKREEGWYLVEQNIQEYNNNGSLYNEDGCFELLDTFIKIKENTLNNYKNIREKLGK